MSTPAQDNEQLRLLSILYYVWGGLGAVFSCLGGIWLLVMSGFFVAAAHNQNGPPAAVAGLIGVVGGIAIVLSLVLAGLSLWAGKCLADRRSYTLCIVVACLTCLSFPLGTALGVFTLIVLSRSTVKPLFGGLAPA